MGHFNPALAREVWVEEELFLQLKSLVTAVCLPSIASPRSFGVKQKYLSIACLQCFALFSFRLHILIVKGNINCYECLFICVDKNE